MPEYLKTRTHVYVQNLRSVVLIARHGFHAGELGFCGQDTAHSTAVSKALDVAQCSERRLRARRATRVRSCGKLFIFEIGMSGALAVLPTMKKLELIDIHRQSEPFSTEGHGEPASSGAADPITSESQNVSADNSPEELPSDVSVQSHRTHVGAGKLEAKDANVAFDGTLPIKRFQRSSVVPGVTASGTAPSSAASSSDLPTPDLQILETNICKLWKETRKQQKVLKVSRSDFARANNLLARELSQYKNALAAKGRNGEWSEFLRNAGIPKATADRYVARVDPEYRKLPQDPNLLTEEVYEKELAALVKRWSRQVREKRFKPEQVECLLQRLSQELVPVSEPTPTAA